MSINRSYLLAGAAIMTSAIVMPMANISQVEAASQTLTITARVNFRTGPSTSYSIMKKLYKGEVVTYLGQQGNWIKIQQNGTTGYVYKDYITSMHTTTANVNFRTGPSTSYSIITTISKGKTVEFISESGDWIKAKYNGNTGYLNKAYVSGFTTIGNTSASTTKYVNASSGLNVRSGPGTGYSKLGLLAYKTKVSVLSTLDGWSKIEYNGGIGYVSSSYLQSTIPSSGGSSTSLDNSSSSVDKSASAVVAYAKKLLGKPYVWGAQGPNSFDCSGFTYYVFKNAAGISIPRTSSLQSNYGTYISKSNLKAGDLVFFDTSGANNGAVSHVGLYIGNGQMIHASYSQRKIVIADFNSSYYKQTYVNARRVL